MHAHTMHIPCTYHAHTMHIQTDSQPASQPGRQAGRQTDRQTYIHNIHTYIHTSHQKYPKVIFAHTHRHLCFGNGMMIQIEHIISGWVAEPPTNFFEDELAWLVPCFWMLQCISLEISRMVWPRVVGQFWHFFHNERGCELVEVELVTMSPSHHAQFRPGPTWKCATTAWRPGGWVLWFNGPGKTIKLGFWQNFP